MHAESITPHVVSSIRRRATEHEATGSAKQSRSLSQSQRSASYVHPNLHAALKDGLRCNRIRHSADATKPPPASSTKAGKKGTRIADQLRDFLDFMANSRNPARLFITTSGCLRGECFGLHWDGVDLDDATASLSPRVTLVDGQVRVKDLPKTKRGYMNPARSDHRGRPPVVAAAECGASTRGRRLPERWLRVLPARRRAVSPRAALARVSTARTQPGEPLPRLTPRGLRAASRPASTSGS